MSQIETARHIAGVQELLGEVTANLDSRAAAHDLSKLASPEVEVFEEYTAKLKHSTYGSDEYKSFLVAMKPALDHHYANNSHHPEFGYAQEEWRAICEYDGLYEVSTMGRVKRVACVVTTEAGSVNVAEKLLPLQPTPKGFLRAQLVRDGITRNHLVHRLVANAFLDGSENKPEVEHLDGDKGRNVVANLGWADECRCAGDVSEVGFFVHCEELDIVSVGCVKMETALRERGMDRASAVGIRRAMDGECKHLGLTFVGYPMCKGGPQSMVGGMSLLDVIEMLIDWKAATERHANGSILKSVEINQARFGYSDDLKHILLNTVKEMGFA